MEHLITSLLLVWCAYASAHDTVGTLIRLQRNAYPVYASDSSEEYEPYAVAAVPVPVHAPLPVLRVYAPSGYTPSGYTPSGYTNKLRRPVKRPRPETDLYAYDTSHVEQTYEPYSDQVYAEYAETETQPKYAKLRDSYEDDASSVIVYARPNKNGGFSYRKPSAVTPAPRVRENEPMVIRIHKYRVIH